MQAFYLISKSLPQSNVVILFNLYNSEYLQTLSPTLLYQDFSLELYYQFKLKKTSYVWKIALKHLNYSNNNPSLRHSFLYLKLLSFFSLCDSQVKSIHNFQMLISFKEKNLFFFKLILRLCLMLLNLLLNSPLMY